MTHYQRQLQHELQAAGSSNEELKQLLIIAGRLRRLHLRNEPARAAYIGNGRRRSALKLIVSASFVVGMGVFLLVVSQSVLPTSWLFPLQSASDDVAVNLDPQYRATVMMKRARQVNQLVSAQVNSSTVLATLADYNRAADAYKSMPHRNYAAYVYCESNLRQAATAASPAVKQAIVSSLRSVEDS